MKQRSVKALTQWIAAYAAAVLLCTPGCAEATSPIVTSLPPQAAAEESVQMRALLDPASEVRGVYIATVHNIDFPTKPDLPAATLRAEIDAILDTAEASGLNTVCFQVRPSADALYRSEIFPVSASLYTDGVLHFDPLAYLVEEAHKRSIYVTAWVNPLRVTVGSAASPKHDTNALPATHPVRQNPDWAIPYADGKLYLDPGIPEVRKLVADGVREIVANYNVDGILFDDYFYPYPVSASTGGTVAFADSLSYSRYGDGMSLADWRRSNINEMIRTVYETVKEVSDSVSFGVAPFGIWQNDDGKNGGSATRGLESYKSIYCDPIAWAEGGYIDYLAPQIYWRFTTSVAPYGELVRWWNQVLDGTGVDLLVSHATYQYDGWEDPAGEMAEQIAFARSELCYRGSIFYGYDEIRRNLHGLRDEIVDVFADQILYTDPSPTGLPPSISSPPAEAYLSDSTTYLIGASSPDKPLTLNGKKIGRTRGGYFSAVVDLVPGENTFVLEQDGVRVTHTVYRGLPPAETDAGDNLALLDTFTVQSVSPSKNVLREGGTSITVSCIAPAGATVTAKLGDLSVRLKQTDNARPRRGEIVAASYSGTLQLPRVAANAVETLGTLRILAETDDSAAEADGGQVRVRGSGAFVPVRVKENHTELKLRQNSYYYDDFSVQSAGMTDNATWQGNGFYLLRVGGYVYEDAVEEIPGGTSIPLGKMSAAAVQAGTDATSLTVRVDRAVPYNGTVRDGVFELTLYNVDVSTVPAEIPVEPNPLIRSVKTTFPNKVNCVRFLCELVDAENFYGFDFLYEDGQLRVVLRNPRTVDLTSETPLSGIRIVLDAGHGGEDIGARGPLGGADGVHEADLNLAVTLAARDRLTALGATVILTREGDTTLSLGDRMDALCEIMPDLSVSIHHNSIGFGTDITKIRGTLGLWWADGGILLTKCVSRAVADALCRTEITPKAQKLALCRNPKFPSTLVEVGFMTSVEEYETMLSGGVEKAADGIAEGILAYYAAQAQWVNP